MVKNYLTAEVFCPQANTQNLPADKFHSAAKVFSNTAKVSFCHAKEIEHCRRCYWSCDKSSNPKCTISGLQSSLFLQPLPLSRSFSPPSQSFRPLCQNLGPLSQNILLPSQSFYGPSRNEPLILFMEM